jgi:hypothetical protein
VKQAVNSMPNGPGGFALYKAQADEVLDVLTNLTDRQKMTAELFNNKIRSLGFSAVFAAFDTRIVVWNEKFRWDTVRRFSAVG